MAVPNDFVVRCIITMGLNFIKRSLDISGVLVVNIWGGLADVENKRPWKKDTLSVFWSTTKGVSSLVIGHLVDRYVTRMLVSLKSVKMLHQKSFHDTIYQPTVPRGRDREAVDIKNTYKS